VTTLQAAAPGSDRINLSWQASTDDVGVQEYEIWRNGVEVATVQEPTTSWIDTGLAAGTTYCYLVFANDGADRSAQGNQACATTASGTNYTLTVAKNGTGSGTVSGTGITCGADCAETVASGTVIALTATPAAGSAFVSWTSCDAPSGATCTMTLNANKTVTATFNPTVCTPSTQTRCVAGNIEVQERCNASGSGWVQVACPAWTLCASGTCRTACGMTSTPVNPTVCLVPIQDGVNNAEWAYWTDSRMAQGTYVLARSQTGSGGYAPRYSEPGEVWPYSFSISSSDIAGVQFKLNQFGAYKHTRLGFRARRAAVITGYPCNFLVGIFAGSSTLGNCSMSANFSWTSTYCYVGTPMNQSFNYAGGWNSMLLSITGDGFGDPIDLMDVNYVWLSVEP
jgi:hypothetical protein